MTQDLRDLMHRVADDVTPVEVAPDTWRRARRGRSRDRIVAPALAVLLVLAGVTATLRPTWLPAPVDPVDRTVVGGAGAVPDHLYMVPEGLDSMRGDGTRSTPLEPPSVVRRAAAAFVTLRGTAVLVSAADGDHHLVDLPGFGDSFAGMDEGSPVAVSPDGRSVAYPWRQRPRPAGEHWPSGLAVLHLDRPGRPEVHRLPGGVGALVGEFSWSPDGRYLVYSVALASRLTEDSYTSSSYRKERLDVRTGRRTPVPPARAASPPAVSSSGVAAVLAGDLVLSSPATGRRAVPVPGDPTGPGAWSASGREIALGSFGISGSFPVVDVEQGRSRLVGGLTPQSTRVLGWVGPDDVLALRHPSSFDRAELVLVDVRSGQARTVGVVEGQVVQSLSVATGLMTLDRPTVEFAPPSWQHDRSWWWAGGGALAVLLAALALLGRRRVRHTGRQGRLR
ncbi:PD40 domain-containing protein [Nocardioides mesophilus]|uniref:PD40 domain-containing protein n=1 Tax=Nocardioides mesophilus TaxID=433659 RepID=A0A7G9RA47_9ACTN|nr:PD40 domain-containing protein [Nocardioides mesophilus]QNN52472.1 PD40 domain-containing protein [Nocardioides mesophilus]